jgi:hypothetical protein
MKCKICGKRQKENTEGNLRYCQGHDIGEVVKFNENEATSENMNDFWKIASRAKIKLY